MVFLKEWFTKNQKLEKLKLCNREYLLPPESLIEQANQGNYSAQFLVGLGLVEGRFGFSINLSEGQKWFKKVVWGNVESPGTCATAHYYISIRSFKKAFLYLKDVEKNKYIPGLYLLAKLKFLVCIEEESKNGVINKAERKNIIKILKECCNENFIPAVELSGRLFLDGWGVKRNIKKGLKLLKQAAYSGDCPAKLYLANLYKEGIPDKIIPNPEESQKWYNSAAEQGSTEAIQKLKEKDKPVNILEWPANDLEKMLKIAIRKSNIKHPKCEWELLREGDKIIVKQIGKEVVFTVIDNESNPSRVVNFEKDATLSEREARFALLICSSPMILNSKSLEQTNVILKTAIKLNRFFESKSLKSVVVISDSMLEKYKNQWDLLSAYPVVKQAFKEQILLSAITVLNNEPDLKGVNIKIDFNDCSLLVSGRVTFDSQKQLALQFLESLPGVKAVINNIQVAPSSSIDLKTSIIKEFEENQIDFNHIIIEIEGKTIILKG